MTETRFVGTYTCGFSVADTTTVSRRAHAGMWMCWPVAPSRGARQAFHTALPDAAA
ncbi:MAG: hypothetical protein AAFQ59_19175 [Pseudomonadota bacterium]